MASGDFYNKHQVPLLNNIGSYSSFLTLLEDIPTACMFMFTGDKAFTNVITGGVANMSSKGFGLRYTDTMSTDMFFIAGNSALYLLRFIANQSSPSISTLFSVNLTNVTPSP